ncbi:MAG: biosynthetic peptidoglycan transglycosylase [Polyangiaceae bacterium]
MKLRNPFSSLSKRWKIAILGSLALVGLLALGAALGVGPYVRHKAKQAAARYGAELEIGSVEVHWKRVVFSDVGVKLEDLPSARIVLREVEVIDGAPRVVHVRGGDIVVTGDLDKVKDELRALKGRIEKGKGESSAGAAPGTEIDAKGLTVQIDALPNDIAATLTGLALTRKDGGFLLEAEKAKLATRGQAFEATGAVVEIARVDGEETLKRLSTKGLDANVVLDEEPAPPPPPPPAASSSAPVAPPKKAPSPKVVTPPAPIVPGPPSAATVRAVALRDRLMAALPLVEKALPGAATIELGGVTAHVRRGTTEFNFGPGTFLLGHTDGRLSAEYRSSASADGKTLVVRTKAPAVGEPFVVELEGGPLTLSTLGLRDGDMHLADVAATTLMANVRVELSADGRTLSVSGDGTLEHLGFDVKAISTSPVREMRLSFRGKAAVELDLSHAKVEDGELQIGALVLHGNAEFTRLAPPQPDKPLQFRLRSTFDVPLTACQTLVDSAPKGLFPTIEGIRMAGSIALKGHANFDTSNLDKDFDLDWTLSNSCRVTSVPPQVDVKNFTHSFKRWVYTPDGKRTEITTGPGTPSWTPYNRISHYMETAVMTCEDGRFQRHDGFDHEAIHNSIRENLRTGKFVRGASTISMQLAKNLYLERDKTISRKLEEAVLTMYLEQALTKTQIMELYLNVVELGPMIYGVGAAANSYFRTSASGLAISQAFFLGSILPAPQVQHFAAGGALAGGWTSHLRMLMKYANKGKRVTDDELEEGLKQIVVRGQPTPMRDPSVPDEPPDPDAPPADGMGTDPAGFHR